MPFVSYFLAFTTYHSVRNPATPIRSESAILIDIISEFAPSQIKLLPGYSRKVLAG